MSLSPISSKRFEAKKGSFIPIRLVSRLVEAKIFEIFLDSNGYLFGLITNSDRERSKKRVVVLPRQKVLPTQIRALRILLSPEMSFLRLRGIDCVEIEPKLLGGKGGETTSHQVLETARDLFLELQELDTENILESDQGKIFSDINKLSEALPILATHDENIQETWYLAQILHMAVDTLLLVLWKKGLSEDLKARYDGRQLDEDCSDN